jgi:fatty-acyl-CoA synthase
LPAFHTGGCICATLGPLWVGGTLILVERFDASAVLDQIGRERVGYLVSVTTMLNDLVVEARRRGTPAPTIPYVTTGAANVSKVLLDDARRIFAASVHNVYGQTEMSAVISLVRRGMPDEDVFETVGVPLTHTSWRIVDPLTEHEQPMGLPGEIRVKGFGRMIGYYRDEDATAAALDADGWLRTGDVGFLNERGCLRVTGRVKEMIIRGGENISAAEIENCLAEHPAVVESAVVGLPDDRLGEVVAAVVKTAGSPDPGLLESLREHCSARLTHFKVPLHFFVTEEFPMTPSRKIQRFRVAEMAATGQFPALMPSGQVQTEDGAP